MYTVASPGPDPDPNPRGGGQLPNPNKCNSTLTSGTREEALTVTSGVSGLRASTCNTIYTFRTKLELWPKLGLVLIWAGPTRN